LVDEGRVTFFCVDSFEAGSGSGRSVSVQGPVSSSVEDPAMRHLLYQGWLERAVVPAIFEILGGHEDIIAFGTSMGAHQAMQFAFHRADLAPLAIGLSGNYDGGTGHVWGERGMGRTSPTPPTMWPASTKTTWSGCASASQSCSCAVKGRGRLIPRVPCPRHGGSQSC
jgi:pimeloyl-ACP methyl ester carboxylesterase